MDTNEKIARLIWGILQRSVLPWKWGIIFSTVSVITGGTQFQARDWTVEITYQAEDSFKVSLIPNSMGETITHDVVLADDLCSVINENITKTQVA